MNSLQMFEDRLEQARHTITPELALAILEESREPRHALQLFDAASAIRDEHLGRALWWTAAIEGIIPCRLATMCRYCSYPNGPTWTREELLQALAAIEALGFRHLHLSGGTNLEGYDAEIVAMVETMRSASEIAIEVNLGPSLGRETVRRLRELRVSSVTSSLETVNPDVFQIAKPGDSLERRKALLEVCEEEGMPTRSMMLVGLGESEEDRIRQLFYLRQLRGLHHVRFSRYSPKTNGAFVRPRCSPWEVARVIAVARLILPGVQLGLAAGNSPDDIPLWFLAGGGNQLLGAAANRKGATGEIAITDRREIQQQFAASLGLQVGFECPTMENRI